MKLIYASLYFLDLVVHESNSLWQQSQGKKRGNYKTVVLQGWELLLSKDFFLVFSLEFVQFHFPGLFSCAINNKNYFSLRALLPSSGIHFRCMFSSHHKCPHRQRIFNINRFSFIYSGNLPCQAFMDKKVL